ncbi:MAG: secretin and TonB N-terminal domain-containing protein [Deltaproteobacteria bacterium]|nr:secretin and TonB N-terminal domain-containing protein [Deltaproteobacteria bacterium]
MNTGKAFTAVWAPLMAGLVVPLLVAQTGCAPLKTPPRGVSATPSVAPARPERPPEERLPGLIVTEIEGKREPERLYSFSLRDADIREVLMALSKQTSFNIVVDPDVQGRVTVDLKNVTMADALDTLTELLGLSYRIKQNIIRVAKPAPETRIFSLQYVNLKRTSSSSASAQIGTGATGTTGAGATGTTGTTTGGTVGGGGGGSTTVSTSTDTDLWRDVEAGVTKLLSPVGKIVVDKQSSNILVTDLPKFLDRIAGFLESVEGSIQRQVLIEARIIEVTLTGEYRFGLDWAAITQAAALRGASTISAGKILGQRLAPAAGGFQVGVTSTDFTALLSVLSNQGELKVISSPKLATLNNQTAVIRAGTDEVFFETRVSETPSLTGTQTSRTISPRTVTIGVVLGITPQVGADGTVVLHIHPTVTEKRGETKSAIGDTFPIIDVREADMVVRAREGQVVIIGGLMQEKRSDSDSKVPILGDLPGIGRLFRSTTQEARKTELVVLLSPTVMVGKKIDEITSREMERLNKNKGRSPW